MLCIWITFKKNRFLP